MKKVNCLILLCVVYTSSILSQENIKPLPYVTFHLGGFLKTEDNFEKVYDSNLGFAVGGDLGFPLSNSLYIIGNVTYFRKTGTPVFTTYTFNSDGTSSISKHREGDAKLSQWFFNLGLEYLFRPSEFLSIGVNGGLAVTTFSERHTLASGDLSYSAAGGLGRYFIGAGVEQKIENLPFDIVAEIQYNILKEEVLTSKLSYGGWNLALGIRKYLSL